MSDDVAYWRQRAEAAEAAAIWAINEIDRLKRAVAVAPGVGLDARLAVIIRSQPDLWSAPVRSRVGQVARALILLTDCDGLTAAELRAPQARWRSSVDEVALAKTLISTVRWLITDLVRLARSPIIPLILNSRGTYAMSAADRQVMRQIIEQVVAAHDAATASLRPVEAAT